MTLVRRLTTTVGAPSVQDEARVKSVGTADYGAIVTTAADRRPATAAGTLVDYVRRARASRVRPTGKPHAPAATVPWAPPAPAVLVGERERRLYILSPENLEYIESQGNYVRLHGGGIDYISRDSIKRLEYALADQGFLRIERSLIVNIRAIVYAQRAGRGRYLFMLHSGVSIRSGAGYRSGILRALPLAPAT
jgi:DNA-binding LytR/AlgR family response regulator